jgi:hypothetical protein
VVAERPDALDLDLTQVACVERPDPGGRAGRDEVSGFERHRVRDVAYEVCDGEGQRAGASALTDLSVDARLDLEVGRVEAGDDVWADGAEGVEGFAACELHVFALEVAGGHVVEAGVAEDVCERVLVVGEAGAPASDNDGEFALVLDPLGGLGQLYPVAVPDDRRRGFEEEQGLFRHGVAQLQSVLAVVASDADDFGGRDRGQEPRVRETD